MPSGPFFRSGTKDRGHNGHNLRIFGVETGWVSEQRVFAAEQSETWPDRWSAGRELSETLVWEQALSRPVPLSLANTVQYGPPQQRLSQCQRGERARNQHFPSSYPTHLARLDLILWGYLPDFLAQVVNQISATIIAKFSQIELYQFKEEPKLLKCRASSLYLLTEAGLVCTYPRTYPRRLGVIRQHL